MEAILQWHAMAPLVIALAASVIAGLALVWLMNWLNRPRPIVMPDDDEDLDAAADPPARQAPAAREKTPAPKPAAAPAERRQTPVPAARPAATASAQAAEPTPGVARAAAPRVGLSPPPAGAKAPEGSLTLKALIAAQTRHLQRVRRHDFAQGPLLLFFKWRAALGANPIALPFFFMPDHTGDNQRKAIEWLEIITSTSRVLVDVLEFQAKDREAVDRWRDFLDWMFKASPEDLKRWVHPAVTPFLYLWTLRDQLGLGISDKTMALMGHDTAGFDGNADLQAVLEMAGARATSTSQYAVVPSEPPPDAAAVTPESPAAADPPTRRVTAELAALDPAGTPDN